MKDASKPHASKKLEANCQAGESKGLQKLASNDAANAVTDCDKVG